MGKEESVADEQSGMLRQRKEYAIPKQYFEIISTLLAPEEFVVIGARQAFPRTLAPGIIVATNKRVLIVKQSFWGLYFGHNMISSSDFMNVHYGNITEITLKNGRWLSTISIRIGGKDIEFESLIEKEAIRLVGFLERMILEHENKNRKNSSGRE